MTDTMRVYVIVLPDGNTAWIDAEKVIDGKELSEFVQAWNKNLPEEKRQTYEQKGVTTGVVTIYMLREDYDKIQANNQTDFSMFKGGE